MWFTPFREVEEASYGAAMAETAKPGWYPRPDMQDTLGFWDGAQWTDRTQPGRVTQDSRNRLSKWVVAVAAIGVIGYAAWEIVTSDDDLQCATERAQAAQDGRPRPDC
jgi:hypothetical protein